MLLVEAIESSRGQTESQSASFGRCGVAGLFTTQRHLVEVCWKAVP